MSNKEKSWFEQNMHAEKTKNGFADCSACSMRNVPQLCQTLTNTGFICMDWKSGCFITWQPNDTGVGYDLLSCHPPREMTDWFRDTPTAEIRRITSQMVRNVFGQKQK